MNEHLQLRTIAPPMYRTRHAMQVFQNFAAIIPIALHGSDITMLLVYNAWLPSTESIFHFSLKVYNALHMTGLQTVDAF